MTAFAARIDALDAQARKVDVDTGTIRLRWRIWGAGPKLILLHGNGGSWLHWFLNIPGLAQDFEVIAADLPGFGDSGLPPPPYRSTDLAAQVLAGIGPVVGDAGPVCVAGFSMGAGIATEVAAGLGARLHHLALIAAGRGFGVPSAPRPDLHRWRALSDPQQRRQAHRHNLDALMLGPQAVDRDLAEALHIRANEATRARFEPETDGTRLHAVLRSLPGGRTAIWGEDDVVMQGFRQARVDYFAAAGATLEFLPGAGHWTQFERPAEINALLRDRCLAGTGAAPES